MAGINSFLSRMSKAEQQLKSVLPRLTAIVKIEGLRFISVNFEKQGFQIQSGSVNAWQKRKAARSKKQQQQNTGRALLVDKGHLRRRWDGDTNIQGSKVVFQNNATYAEVHNEGGKSGRNPGFQMPKRQMIGDSPVLDEMIQRKITAVMDSIFK